MSMLYLKIRVTYAMPVLYVTNNIINKDMDIYVDIETEKGGDPKMVATHI